MHSMESRGRIGWRFGGIMAGWLAVLLCLASPSARGADRHAEWANRFAQGPKAELQRATFFGAGGHEEAVGVFHLEEGEIVMIGNAWGPPFPSAPTPRVWGTDALHEVPLHPPGMETDRQGRPRPPAPENPNRTGFLVTYAPDLSSIRSIRRFGWGVANITAGRQFPDRSIVITGRAAPGFRRWAEGAKHVEIVPRDPESRHMGPVEYAGVELPGDSYVAKFAPDLQTVEWVWIFEGHNQVPDAVHEGMNGEVVVNTHGIKRIAAGGRSMIPVHLNRDGLRLGSSLIWRFLAVSPRDGTILYGGDHQSNTGREPWRKPILLGFTPEGEMKYRLYDWDGPLVGNDVYRLVSDSSVTIASFSRDGTLSLHIHSDGGNTVATRNPIDLERPVDSKGIGMSSWGAGVGSFAHFTRFDPDTCEHVWYSLFAAYTAQKPNSIRVRGMLALDGGETVVWGGSASFLVQTPNAFYRCEKEHGGRDNFFTIFNRDFDNALFSSAMAMCDTVAAAGTDGGVVIVSTARGEVDATPFENRVPVQGAVQGGYGGGLSDAHILLMRLPDGEEQP